jgi:hypothetical protein
MSNDLRSWRDFDAALGNRESMTIANNTSAVRDSATGDIRVILHSTAVVTHHMDGTVTYFTGGYATMTTKERMNRFGLSMHSIGQRKGRWYLRYLADDRSEPLDDGGTYGPMKQHYFGGTTFREVRAA